MLEINKYLTGIHPLESKLLKQILHEIFRLKPIDSMN